MSGAFHRRAVGLLLAAACGGSTAQVASVSVSPADPRIVVGDTLQLDATALDDQGQPLAGVAVTWRSANEARATISDTGLVTGVSPGESMITASAGGRTGSVRARVLDGGVVSPSGGHLEALGGTVTLDIPAGALTAPTAIGIERTEPAPLDPRLVGETVVTVSSAASFASPATLALSYDPVRGPVGLPEGSLRVAAFDSGAWQDIAGSTDDTTNRVARASIAGAGTYAVRQMEPAAPCAAAEDRQFDFWLGAWTINPSGRSEITRDAAGCNIDELFTDREVIGRSVSFYNPDTASWYQTYVDNTGARLRLSGGVVGGKMVLTTVGGGQNLLRITWEQLGANVRQLGEQSADGGATWTVAFDGLYSPS